MPHGKTTIRDYYDIIIIGGGMVGASLACALRHTALRIALIDAAPLNAFDDHRLIALTHSSYQLLRQLNVWDALLPHAEPIQQVHVSDRGHFGAMRLRAKEIGLAALGYVVPAKQINAALHDIIRTSDTLDIIRPAQLKALSQQNTQATIVIETASGERQLTGTLIIGADGSHSTVRTLLNIPTDTTPCQQSALVTITELQRPHHNIAYERFHTHGAIAMLPLTGQRVATILTDQNHTIADYQQLDDARFLSLLQSQFGYRLGKLLRTQQRFTYPLLMIKAQQTIQGQVVLIGNAAHTLSPIAAQGLNLALAEIALLTQTLLAQQDQLHAINWDTYHAAQRAQQSTSTRLSHQLPWLFAQDLTLIQLARQVGLIGIDICPPIKKLFTRRALGINLQHSLFINKADRYEQ